MSDLTATNCSCGCERNERSNGFGSNSCIWIILLLLFCGGGCGNGCGGSSRGGFGCGDDSCLWIIILLFFCGGFGNNGGCGCDNGCF